MAKASKGKGDGYVKGGVLPPFWKYRTNEEILRALSDVPSSPGKGEKILTADEAEKLLRTNSLSASENERYHEEVAICSAAVENAATREEIIDLLLKFPILQRAIGDAVTGAVERYLQEAVRFKQKQASDAPLHEFTGQLSEIAALMLLADRRTAVLSEAVEQKAIDLKEHMRQIAIKPRPSRKSTLKAATIEAMRLAREEDGELFKDYLLRGGCGAIVEALPGEAESDMHRKYRIEAEGFEPETKSGRTLSGWWNEAGKKSHTD